MQDIPFINLAVAFVPVAVAAGILFYWSLQSGQAFYSIIRMLAQLLLIGYVLVFIFEANHAGVVLLMLMVMMVASSWIALRTVKKQRMRLFWYALLSITIGGVFTLFLMTWGVLRLEPWYEPRTVISLAGMIFANAMNSVSLAAERLYAEMERGNPYVEARRTAMNASMIPVINSMFAVGLVSLPGMMTGQILSGVSPLIAARYQIMVMCMIFGASGISTACFLTLIQGVMEK